MNELIIFDARRTYSAAIIGSSFLAADIPGKGEGDGKLAAPLGPIEKQCMADAVLCYGTSQPVNYCFLPWYL